MNDTATQAASEIANRVRKAKNRVRPTTAEHAARVAELQSTAQQLRLLRERAIQRAKAAVAFGFGSGLFVGLVAGAVLW